MLSIELVRADNTVCAPDDLLTVRLNADLDVPADSLELTLPYRAARGHDFTAVNAYLNGGLVFTGEVDEIIRQRTGAGVTLHITARSRAAGLLDNEAEPLFYHNPSAAFICERHLRPFGITAYTGEGTPFYGDVRIDKGMSHWQALERFCRARYGAQPRVTGDGRAILDGSQSAESVTFAQGDYLDIRESRDRSRLISQVKLRVSANGGYDAVLRNPNPSCAGVRRERYVNTLADNTSLATADRMIANGNRRAYLLRLRCAGCRIDAFGKRAAVEDRLLGSADGLRVTAVRYRLGADGELTELELRKEEW